MHFDPKYLAYVLVLLYFIRRMYWIIRARSSRMPQGSDQWTAAMFRKAYDRISLGLLGMAGLLLILSWQGYGV